MGGPQIQRPQPILGQGVQTCPNPSQPIRQSTEKYGDNPRNLGKTAEINSDQPQGRVRNFTERGIPMGSKGNRDTFSKSRWATGEPVRVAGNGFSLGTLLFYL